MAFGNIISSPRGSLSLQQVLDLASIYLENARKTPDPNVALVLCHDTETSLSHVKRAAKNSEDKVIREGIATIYNGLGELLNTQGHRDEAQAFYKKSEKWGGRANESGRHLRPTGFVYSIKSALHSTSDTTTDKSSQNPSTLTRSKQGIDTATIPKNIFPTNVHPPTIVFSPPEPDSRINDTPQLACCLELLQSSYEPDDILDPAARNWLLCTKNEQDERDRLESLATDVIRAFKRDELKDSKAVTEVIYLAPVLENKDFRYLLKEFYSGIDQSGLLDIHQLEGIAQLIQGADPGYLDSDDLVKVLSLLSTRLRDTHQQSTNHLYQLTVAVSHVLDAMADANVSGLDREKIHEPLSSYLDGLKSSSDPYLVYQAAYAYQALLCVPDDESLWQASFRRAGKVIQGVSGLVSAVKGLDLNGFVDGLKDIQQGLAGASEVVQLVKTAYDGAMSLAESGQGFFDCLKEGLSFNRKCAWYSALRGADTLIREGQLAEFRKLVCEAPCRHDAAFQWGVCQRLGEVAINSLWTAETRQSAIAFLGEIYQNDPVWGYQANVKQWILNILMQLSSGSGSVAQFVEALLKDLRKDGDTKKQAMYLTCLENRLAYPLKVSSPVMGSPSLLDRVQERPDVEGALRQLRRHRLKERGNAVYIPPQAKASLQARDEACFPLMERVDDFMASDHKVLLLLGVSGAGKSTFNRELECRLWRSYKKNAPIPLHINLPAIDKPEHDMIVKQLRRAEFTEPQIRELKLHRTFTLICDGYDESQLTHNLYTSNRLNEPGEWNAKMVITCRSEYVGVDYRDRFQPGGRNQRSGSALFQEVVMTPFSLDQVQDYISQYVSVYRPLWEADEYRKALELIPSLKELVKNPFLMSLSLEVLPRIVDPGQGISATHVTRMALYDQFIENWLERGKKRLGEKNLSPQAKAAFESLTDEGFTRNGIDYLKKLSVAIYKEQGGQPIVSYSRYKDEDTWKANFFNRDDEKQLLREACPLTRNGNQHRFIHRSLLEYGVALAIFDPQEVKERTVPESSLARRGSAVSALSSDEPDPVKETPAVSDQKVDLNSPLAWRSFVNEPSVLQFLEERVQQEPLFRQQLVDVMEQSKSDKRWRTAASNAITILVRSGVQFNNADLRGIQIPNADLSYGMFDSAQFQGADLRLVDFRGTWLRRANLSQARITGVQFGELPFLKQDSEVELCAYSPDGKTIAAGLSNGVIVIHSTSNWESPLTLNGHSRNVTSLEYSSDSNQIASGSRDRTVRLWDVLTGACIHVMSGHVDKIRSIAYSPQGDHIASASDDKTVKLWDVDTGACRYTWTGHTYPVLGVVYSPLNTQIASGSDDRTVRLWDIGTETCLRVLRGHRGSVESITYSPQGDKLASASKDKTVRLWDVATGDCHYVLTRHTDSVISVAYSPNGDQVASASADKSVRLWDADTGACLYTLLGHSSHVRRVVYSPQGDLVASASNDKTVRLWDAETGVIRQTLTGHSGVVSSVAFSPKGDQVASSSIDKTVRLWDIGAESSRHISNGHTGVIRMVKLSPKGDYIVTCSDDMTARLWDVETGICNQVLQGHRASVYAIVYSFQGDQIATCSADRTIRLWCSETAECSHVLSGHTDEVNEIAFSPHGNLLASASEDNTVRLWDVKSGECCRTLTDHEGFVMGVTYSSNGNQIVSFGWDSTVRIWDVETGVCNHTLIGHSSSDGDATYSLQGDQIASVSEDTMVRVWDVVTGECRHMLIGHDAEVCSVVFSPIGDQIASGDTDGSLRVWDLEAATCLWTLDGHDDEINRILYSTRGDLVISASSDQSVRLWDITSGQCRAVIQDFQGTARDIAWIDVSSVNYLATVCSDGSVGMWRVRVDGDQCYVSMSWMTTKGELNVQDTIIQEVQGLSQPNRQLLRQRGAIGEPANRLREASKKLTTMASVVSKLKTPTDVTKEDPALTSIVSAEQLEQLVTRVKDPKLRDMLAVCFKDIHEYM